MTTEALLSEVPFFQLMDSQERKALANLLEVVQAPAGQMLFNYGDPGGSLYIVRAGEVQIMVKDNTGTPIVLETVTPGEFFGELSLLDGGVRTASALVTQPLEALQLDRDALDQFLRVCPSAAIDMLTVMGKRLRHTSDRLRHTASRNANEEMEDKRTVIQKVADWIAEFSGSIAFLAINASLFLLWILVNTDAIPGLNAFDPFPFGLLTMAVSLEAIFLSIFVLISQNRQAAKDRIRSDIEYDVNLKAELEVAQLHEKVDHLHAEMLTRLSNIERTLGRPQTVSK